MSRRWTSGVAFKLVHDGDAWHSPFLLVSFVFEYYND